MWHISCVMCLVSHVMCHLSDVGCHVYFFVGKMAELLVKGLLSTGPNPSISLPIKVHPAACLEMSYIFFFVF